MRKIITLQNILVLILLLVCIGGAWVIRQPSPNSEAFHRDNASFDAGSFSQYERGIIEEIVEERVDDAPQNKLVYQYLKVRLSTGDKKGEIIETEFNRITDASENVKYRVGDTVVLGKTITPPAEGLFLTDEYRYEVIDKYRVNGLWFAVIVFVLLACIFGRSKGLLSVAGLAVTGIVLIFFVAPQLLQGKDPVVIAALSSAGIAIVTMFIAHGFNVRTKISIVSTLVSLVCAIGLSYLFVYAVQLFGFGGTDATLLQTGYLGALNLRGLLLAGLIISLLGVLDDVTTAQTATIDELHKANAQLGFRQLYSAAMSVGREHIASLVNTLILVYVGAGLPLFLLLVAASNQPLWVLFNSENIAEEIIRAIAGSAALIIAVPISTVIAAYVYSRKQKT